ncbi:MAG: putative porin [Bacteroidales bacterium]
MKPARYIDLVLFFIILWVNRPAFTQDSIVTVLDSSKVYFFFNHFDTQGPNFITTLDTSITSVQKYDPLTKPGNYYASLGNPGSENQSMVYKPYLKSGFDFGIRSLDKYMFTNDSIKYYWVGVPYTKLFYIMGSKKEQNLHIDHTQNIASWFTFGMRFRYINSPGYYQNQETDNKNFVIKTRFQTRNYRYMVLANYIHNKLKLEENGGIKYDTLFEQNIIDSRQGMEVNLTTANNYIKENGFFVKQFFSIQNRNRFRRTISADSTGKITGKRINPGSISHSILYSNNSQLYRQSLTDNNGFYKNTFDSINPTYDSTHILKIENQFVWTNTDNARDQLLTFNFSLKYNYIELSVDSNKRIYNELIPSGTVGFTLSKRLKLDFIADYVFGNSNGGDYKLSGHLSFFSDFGNLKYKITSTLQEPGKFYNYYSSNNFYWDNDLRKQSFFINSIEYNYKKLTASVNFINVGSLVYFDTLANPGQVNGNTSIFNASIRKLFNAGNWSFDLRAIYQNSSNTEAVRIPEIIGDVSIYYTKDLFKQAAILQTGIDALYNTSYYANAYMPATKSFYIQNGKIIGDYIYANVFLNLQVKRARLFLKYHNLGFLFKDFSYYTVPSYPMKDGGFRFGISWMFYD